jgi:hypothetical protein
MEAIVKSLLIAVYLCVLLLQKVVIFGKIPAANKQSFNK